jgi:hypothetical protein
MDRVDVLDWYWSMPVVTRLYFTGCCAVTLLCALDLITPFDVYYNWHAVAQRGQVWRVVTNFLFFGNFGIDFLFHMYFIVRYSRGLEEGRAFAGRPGDFLFCLAFGMAAIMAAAPFTSMLFFGQSLSFMLVYLWAKRNPDMQISMLGVSGAGARASEQASERASEQMRNGRATGGPRPRDALRRDDKADPQLRCHTPPSPSRYPSCSSSGSPRRTCRGCCLSSGC